MGRKKVSAQIIPPIEFRIPSGHLRVVININQGTQAVDKNEALTILQTRPYVAKLKKLKYCGTTSKYHVFSYPDPSLK